MPIPKTHSVHHLASHILPELETFNISKGKFAALTTDEGGSAPFVVEDLNSDPTRVHMVEEQHCACHMCVTAQKHAFKNTFNKFPDFETLLLQALSLASAWRFQPAVRANIIHYQHQHQLPRQ